MILDENIFELDEYVLNGGLGGVNMGFGIPPHAFLGYGVKPYTKFIEASMKNDEFNKNSYE